MTKKNQKFSFFHVKEDPKKTFHRSQKQIKKKQKSLIIKYSGLGQDVTNERIKNTHFKQFYYGFWL